MADSVALLVVPDCHVCNVIANEELYSILK